MSELYTLPDGWEWSNFKDSLYLTDFVANGSFASLKEIVNYLDKKDYAILVRLKDFSSKWNGDYIYVDKHSYDFLSKSSLNENDIMMCNVGSVGLHFRVPNLGQPMTIGPNSILIRPSVNYLDNSFLYYYFSSNIFKDFLETIIAKTAQPKFNKTGFKTLSIPLPSLEEQKRIVAKLDNLFAKIDKATALHQKNIDEANVFMASVLNDVFVELEEKYEKLFLNDVSTFQNGFAFKSNEFNTTGNGLQVIRIGNVLDINKNQVFIEKRKEFEKYLLKENDIVISMTGTRGKKDYLFVRVITSNDSYLNQRVGKISNKNNSNYMYLYYFLQSNYFRDKIFEFETGTVNQGNISSKDILNTKIPLPNMQVQQKVVSYLDEISQKMEKIKQIQKEKMQSLKALKASILDQAFKGEL